MTDILCAVASVVLLSVSFVGCVVPVLPGPVLAYSGLLVLLPSRFAPTVPACLAFGVAGAVILLLDYLVPALGAKSFNCSRWGMAGCVVGTFVGLFFAPWGLLAGPFVGAVLGELVAGKTFAAAVRGGVGAFLGFVCGVLLKLTYCATCAGWCIHAFFA